MWDSPNDYKEELIHNCTYLCGCLFLKSPSFAAVERKPTPNFTQCPIFYRPSTLITVHLNAQCSFLACRYRPQYCTGCPTFKVSWLAGSSYLESRKECLAVVSTKLSANISWSEKLQTEADLSVCFQTIVILNQDRRKGRDQELFKKQQEEESQMDTH